MYLKSVDFCYVVTKIMEEWESFRI